MRTQHRMHMGCGEPLRSRWSIGLEKRAAPAGNAQKPGRGRDGEAVRRTHGRKERDI